MTKYRNRKGGVYRSDIYSYSIYPRINKNFSNTPINRGEVYTVSIIDVNEKGQGVAKVRGFPVYVFDATVGDKVKVKITKVYRNFALAEVIEWIQHVEEY